MPLVLIIFSFFLTEYDIYILLLSKIFTICFIAPDRHSNIHNNAYNIFYMTNMNVFILLQICELPVNHYYWTVPPLDLDWQIIPRHLDYSFEPMLGFDWKFPVYHYSLGLTLPVHHLDQKLSLSHCLALSTFIRLHH